jgi:hypothetical protein
MVVDDVEDLDFAAVGQLPVGDVGLPAFVRLFGAKGSPRRAGPLPRLRHHQAAARQDPMGCRQSPRATSLLLRPSTLTAVITSRAIDMGHPQVKEGANYVPRHLLTMSCNQSLPGRIRGADAKIPLVPAASDPPE